MNDLSYIFVSVSSETIFLICAIATIAISSIIGVYGILIKQTWGLFLIAVPIIVFGGTYWFVSTMNSMIEPTISSFETQAKSVYGIDYFTNEQLDDLLMDPDKTNVTGQTEMNIRGQNITVGFELDVTTGTAKLIDVNKTKSTGKTVELPHVDGSVNAGSTGSSDDLSDTSSIPKQNPSQSSPTAPFNDSGASINEK